MKKKLFFAIPTLVLAICTFFYFNANIDTTQELTVDELRAQHQDFIDNSPFKKTVRLSKNERKDLGLPPNGYYERLWELTLDPKTGRPMPEKVMELQERLRRDRESSRGVGGDGSNPWIDRGPNNVGGRTRGIMFDPNDVGAGNGDGTDYNRVFAGGVSGGLWVNNDITSSSSSWTLVPGIGANISVTVIISDPNNSNIFYLGSGESYTSGDAVGRGIWKSTDGGVTWSNIFGGYTGLSGTQFINGIFYINDLVARDVGGGATELYAAVASSFHKHSSPSQFHGLTEMGLYKSVNNGTSWTRFAIQHGDTSYKNPNDIELDINNNIWFSTTRNSFGNLGGDIYRSTDGITFTLMETIAGASRTDIETSSLAANTLWVLANVGGQADLFTTTDAFATAATQILTEPSDADTGIPNSDFTRGQAFYDLVLEADASDNLIAGGIDLFRSTDNGATWSQISKWSNNNNLAALGISLVHADQHAAVFRPGAGNGNKLAFGNDGGIYYSDDITLASGSTTAISSRNKDYNTVQFYYGDIVSVINTSADDLVGGTQDNGTPVVLDAGAGANATTDITGGDGGYTEYDDSGAYIVTAYPGNDHRIFVFGSPNQFYSISTLGPDAAADPLNVNSTNGNFINEAALDKNLNILYTNAVFSTSVIATGAPVSTTYQIERASNLTSGSGSVVKTYFTDALLNSSPSAMKVSPFTAGSTKLFIGLTNGRLLRVDTADTAPAWTNISGPSFVGSISDIEFGQSESEIFVTMHNYGVTSIWFTSNGGTSWSSKEGDLADMPVKCILQNPLEPEEVIIGTQIGVWSTTDITAASPTWVQSNNGMSDVPVLDLDLRTSDNVILASTFGRGMFTSQFTSNLSVADNSLSKIGIRVFPTINDGNFTVMAKTNIGNVNMRVYSLLGQEVHNSEFQLSNARSEFNLKANSGVYFVKLKGDTFEGTQKIIVK